MLFLEGLFILTKLDVDFVRKQFPSFQFREVAGNGFFENAGF